MNNAPEPYTPEGHAAWLDSLSADELLVIHMPSGYRFIFIAVALAKRGLENHKSADQLLLLKKINGLTDQNFTPEMLATIEPMGDTEYAIFKEARSLDAGDKASMAGFEVLTSPRVFWHLVTLNPSLLKAIKLREGASRNGDLR